MKDFHRYIDYTLLNPATTRTQIQKIWETAVAYDFAAVCVPPCYIASLQEFRWQTDSRVKTCSVINFPLGQTSLKSQLAEIEHLSQFKVDELDFVVPIYAIKNGDWETVKTNLTTLVHHLREHEIVSKIILEISLLTDAELLRLGEICNEAKPDFVKTATGFTGISTWDLREKVEMLHNITEASIALKVSGGVKTYEQAIWFIQNCNAQRIGTSSLLLPPTSTTSAS